MDNIIFLSLILLLAAFLPPAIGYWRKLGNWTMARLWLWLLLPVIGWFVALSIAIDTDPSSD